MNYYQILGVTPYASPEELRKAYHNLIKQYHPDNYKGDSNIAKEMIREINVAYDTLSDPEKKIIYDYDLRHNSKENIKSNSNQGGASSFSEKNPEANKETPTKGKKPKIHEAKVKNKDRNKRKIRIWVPNIKGCLWSIIGYACVALIIFKALGGQINNQELLQMGEEFTSKQVHQVTKIFDRDKNINKLENFKDGTPSCIVAEFLIAMKKRYDNKNIKVTKYISSNFGREFKKSSSIDDDTLKNNCIFNDKYIKYYRDDYWKKCSEFNAWIENEEISGSKAKIKVEIDTINYARAVEKAYTDLAITNAKKMKKNLYGLPDSDLPIIFVKKLKKDVWLYDKTYIVNITFTLQKKNKHWIITDCNDMKGLCNALLANGFSSIDTGEFDYLLLKYIK